MQRNTGLPKLLREPEEQDQRSLHCRFSQALRRRLPNVTGLAMATYQGFRLWAEAVKKAASIDRIKVIEALETGISIDAPSGKVTIDPPTHHCVLDVHIAEVSDRKLKVLEDFAQQKPVDTAAVCDLIKNPNDNQQYVIKI
jgi:urea transport system substrate-binding protein